MQAVGWVERPSMAESVTGVDRLSNGGVGSTAAMISCALHNSLDKVIKQFYIAVVLQCSKTSAGTLTKSA